MTPLVRNESASIGLNETWTRVRGGGYGSNAWVARVTGPDARYGLAREFVRKDASGLSGSSRSGTLRFAVTQPGYYEFRGLCVGSTPGNWEWSGFARIDADGTVTEVSREDVLAAVAQVA